MEFILNPDGAPSRQGGNGGQTAIAAGDLIKESNTSGFAVDVMEASQKTPVIVDFWAPWCGPCKTLGPMLEKAVRHAGGLVRMVKINIDENQELAAQLRIQSIPTVYAFKGGRPVDGFTGALPESQIKSFVDRLLAGHKPPLDAALEQAEQALKSGDAETAYAIYNEISAQEPDSTKALAGMIRALVALGHAEEAQAMIDGLTPEMLRDTNIAAAVSAVELASQGSAVEILDTSALEARIAANPKDHQARLDLATACYGAGRAEEAIDQLVESVRRERGWNDEAARKQLVKIFDALGPTDPLTVAGRRKLSSVLFS